MVRPSGTVTYLFTFLFAATVKISGKAFVNFLQSKVANAQASCECGQINATTNQLDVLRNQLSAQRGQKISETAFLALDAAVL